MADHGRPSLLGPTWHRFLSPHYDDVSISCGGTATLLSAFDHVPEVAVVFAEGGSGEIVTPFAEEQHRRWGLDEEGVNPGRQREERAAAMILGTVARFLPFPDAIYRGDRYLNDDQLFGDTSPDEADMPVAIGETLGLSSAPDLAVRIYAPLALGNHVDHQHVFAAALDAANRGLDIWFYEDLPYGLQPSSRAQRFQALHAMSIDLTVAAVVDVTTTWRQKLDAIMCYASQLDVIFRHAVIEASRGEIDRTMRAYALQAGGNVHLAERYWRLR
jgi:LmbE family N-acetylglucosaminyl deacetylase